MQVEIITIGDEILIGQIVDTNSAWMATALNQAGFAVKQITSVHDDAAHITQALDEAFLRADIVLITGGLGPTKDDITKHTLAHYFHTQLVPDEDVRKHIHQLYKDRPDVLNRLTETQCLVPQNCRVIPNDVGSAPIMWFNHNHKVLVCMPGVPYEMEWAMTHHVIPALCDHFQTPHILHQTTLVYGLPESALALQIQDWEDALPNCIHLAYLPNNGIIKLRLSGSHTDAQWLTAEMERQRQALAAILPKDNILAFEDKPLELVLFDLLREQNATVGSAESCTGGNIAALLAKQPGSSAFYLGSVVSYANSIKENVLGVNATDLATHGAVSEPVVRQMAEGARRLLGTTYAVATSGIAGPTGGSPEKPVGTVWMAVATPTQTLTHCFHFGRLRQQNIQRATTAALVFLIRTIRK